MLQMSSTLFGDTMVPNSKMPSARVFPVDLGIPLAWDIRQVCLNLVKKQTEIAAARQMQFKNNLFSVPEFLALVPELSKVVTLDSISISWVSDTRRKRAWLPWEVTASALKRKTILDSVSEKPLDHWKNISAADIRKMFRPQSTAKRQFNCKLKFWKCCLQATAESVHNLEACASKTCHVVLPAWCDDLPVCMACSTPIPFAQKPDKVFSRCPQPKPINKEFLSAQLQRLNAEIDGISSVIAKLCQ